jgi:hypothetical protein
VAPAVVLPDGAAPNEKPAPEGDDAGLFDCAARVGITG